MLLCGFCVDHKPPVVLALAAGPMPPWPHRRIAWPDLWLPRDRVDALDALREVLRRAREHLDAGRPLSELSLEPGQRALLAPLFPVSAKPAVVVANVDEALLPDGGAAAATLGPEAVVVPARLEAELVELDPAEAAEYRSSYGLRAGGLDAVAGAVWRAGGLITYFTAGEPEVRAWPCDRDSPAPVAAGVIHTDFEKHFIRAEVTSVDELVEAGSMEALRAAGRLRVEGREYRVQDGDVVFFRIGR